MLLPIGPVDKLDHVRSTDLAEAPGEGFIIFDQAVAK
jgi:hypothetical protein